MNVWIVNHYANTPDAGSSTRHYSLGRVLVDRGHRVTIVAAGFHHWGKESSKTGLARRMVERVEHGGVRYVFMPASEYSGNGPGRVRNMLQFTWGALRYEPVGEKPDVVIGSSAHPLAAWAGQRLARRHGAPFVFEVRDLWPQSFIDLGTFGPRNPLAVALRALEGFLYRRAVFVISLLPYAHEYIERFGVPRERVLHLPNGVDLSHFPAERAPDGREPFTLMYFGAHGAPNALDTLLDAAGELERRPASRPVLWRFIGEGTEKGALMRRASEAGLRSVRFEGRVSKSRIPTLAAEADGFVMSLKSLPVYRYGISPNKLFDYLAARRPVIFASSARNNPVAEAGAGITVPPENPPAVAEAVRRLASLSPEERDEMGLRGRRYVEAHYSYERLGERLEEALEELVATA